MFPVDELIPLHMIPAGATARVAQLLGASADVQRLKELGLNEGAAVEMVQSGLPCIVRLAGHKLCFRNGDSFKVLVRMGAGA